MYILGSFAITPSLPPIRDSDAVKHKQSVPGTRQMMRPTDTWLKNLQLKNGNRSHSLCQNQTPKETSDCLTERGMVNILSLLKTNNGLQLTHQRKKPSLCKLDYRAEGKENIPINNTVVIRKRNSNTQLKPLMNVTNTIRTHVLPPKRVTGEMRRAQLVAKYMEKIPLTAWTVDEDDDLFSNLFS